CPPDAIVSRKTSGLVSAKFDGASASMYCRVKKSTFLRVCSSSPSTLATAWCSQRAVIRYDCLTRSNRKYSSQSSWRKRLSVFAGWTTGEVDWPMSFSIDDCHNAEYSHHRFICV